MSNGGTSSARNNGGLEAAAANRGAAGGRRDLVVCVASSCGSTFVRKRYMKDHCQRCHTSFPRTGDFMEGAIWMAHCGNPSHPLRPRQFQHHQQLQRLQLCLLHRHRRRRQLQQLLHPFSALRHSFAHLLPASLSAPKPGCQPPGMVREQARLQTTIGMADVSDSSKSIAADDIKRCRIESQEAAVASTAEEIEKGSARFPAAKDASTAAGAELGAAREQIHSDGKKSPQCKRVP